jgi:hypothetical protein
MRIVITQVLHLLVEVRWADGIDRELAKREITTPFNRCGEASQRLP